jgi:hypothetical protein
MPQNQKGPSWAFMLAIVGIAILIALLIAHKMIAPFFHHR